MTRTERNARNAAKAAAAYAGTAERVNILLDEIKNGLADHAARADQINYGHVGDLQHYESLLANVADSLLRRGEYA